MRVPHRKWMWVTLLLTLVLGMSLGVLLDEFVLGGDRGARRQDDSREDRSGRFKAMLVRELELSPEQVEGLERILASNNEKARAFWRDTRSAYAELRKQFREEIRALLRPEQQQRFDEMMVEHDQRRQNDKKER